MTLKHPKALFVSYEFLWIRTTCVTIFSRTITNSGVETNLKVGGHMSSAKRRKFLSAVSLHFFASTSTILFLRLGECFRFLVCCSTQGVLPPCPAICKSGGGHVPYGVDACAYYCIGLGSLLDLVCRWL